MITSFKKMLETANSNNNLQKDSKYNIILDKTKAKICCQGTRSLIKIYKKQLGFSMYLGTAILFTFYPVLNDFSSILFVKDELDLKERQFFLNLLPYFTFFQLFLILLNIKFKFTKKRNPSCEGLSKREKVFIAS